MRLILKCFVCTMLAFALFYLVSADASAESNTEPPGFYALYCWPENYIQYADDIRQTGVDWVRMGGFGSDIKATDQAMLLAARHQTHIAPTLFIRELSHENTLPVDEAVKRFRKYVRQTVSRYAPEGSLWRENPDVTAVPIRYWEIWNEPNIEFLTPPDETILRTELYAKLLVAASQEIRTIDPGARIVAFNTAGGVPYRGKGIPPDGMWEKLKYIGWRKFISDVVALAGTDCFDIVGTHPYTKPRSPEAGQVIEGVGMIQEIAEKQGFADKPIWFTEVGFPLVYPRNQQVRDEREQACFTVRLLAISAVHGVKQVQIMYVEDIVYGPDQTTRSFGFYTTPGQWREQAKATQTMIRLLPEPGRKVTIINEDANGVWAYLFEQADGQSIIMAWYTGKGTMTLTLDTQAEVATLVDMLGATQPIDTSNNRVTFQLTEAPIYLVPYSEAETKKLLSPRDR